MDWGSRLTQHYLNLYLAPGPKATPGCLLDGVGGGEKLSQGEPCQELLVPNNCLLLVIL